MNATTRSFFLFLALSATTALAEPAAGQAGFDLPALERQAMSSGRGVLAARQLVDAARHAVDGAAAFPNPELEYLGGTVRSRAPGGNPGDARSVLLTQPLDMPWRRAPRIAAAEAGLDAAVASVRAYEADVLARVRLRYFEVLRREAELLNAREDKALVKDVRSRIALRVETGEAPRFELIKVDAELLNAQKTVQAAGLRVEQARSLLRQSVGDGLPESFVLLGSLREVPELPPVERMRHEVAEGSPDLVRARAETARAEQQLALERAQRWPSVALKGGVEEDPDTRTSRLGLVVTIPLWDRRGGPIGEASAHLARTRHELAAQEFTLERQLEVAVQQHEIAQAQVNALESGILRQAQSALKVAEAAYRFGERGFLEVLDAQRVFRAARAELIAARYELAAAWVEIERLRATPRGKYE